VSTIPRTLEILRGVLAGGPDSSQPVAPVAESSFRSLLNGIVALEFEPGQMLSERELMERTGSSRAALRQAVARLSDLGLITPHPRKGLIVAPLDVLEVSAVYDARLAIESALAHFAAQRATPAHIASLQDLSDAHVAEDEDTAAFVSRDIALHLAIAAAGRNRYLEDALTRILPLSARLWHRLYQELGTDQKFMFHHTDIIGAIAQRNPDRAEVTIRHHLLSARDTLAYAFMPHSSVTEQ
jgi:DNA-binding GntR family transcriptional regulator